MLLLNSWILYKYNNTFAYNSVNLIYLWIQLKKIGVMDVNKPLLEML